MSRKFYHILMVVLIIWAISCIPTILLPSMQRVSLNGVLYPIGVIMIPIATIGLWNRRIWGLIILLLATVIAFIATRRIDMIVIHLIILGLSVIYYLSKTSPVPK